jgi:hypothetical protein
MTGVAINTVVKMRALRAPNIKNASSIRWQCVNLGGNRWRFQDHSVLGNRAARWRDGSYLRQ